MQQELNRHSSREPQTSISPLTYGPQPPPALNTLPAQTQQYLLIRDLLQVLSGVEGQYIRVAAAGSGSRAGEINSPTGTTNGTATASVHELGRKSALRSSQQGSGTSTTSAQQQAGATLSAPLQKASDAAFLIDLDSADRSCANQVQQICVFMCMLATSDPDNFRSKWCIEIIRFAVALFASISLNCLCHFCFPGDAIAADLRERGAGAGIHQAAQPV